MIDYDKLLDEWADKVYAEMARYQSVRDDHPVGSYKDAMCRGHIDGLASALALLSIIEKKAKRTEERR